MPLPVINIPQMREWEGATWSTGVTEREVIERVGKIVAKRALKMTRPGEKIVILAGKGHNGDDARASQPHLHGREVCLLNVADPREAALAFSDDLKNSALIIDGLFGIGISRPLDDSWQKLIQAINSSLVPVLSIDVPSGLNGDSGDPEGAAVQAAVTLTIGAPKRGLILTKAAEWVGRLEVAPQVGLVLCPHSSEVQWILPEDFRYFPPQRRVATNKGSFGHVAVFAGTLGYHGAAVMTARGSLQAQPGLVSVFTSENTYFAVAAQSQAAMVHIWRVGQKPPANCSAIVFGPGLAMENFPAMHKNELRSFWNESPLPVVADASAIDWLPPGVVPKNPLRVMTPHPGEAARLLRLTKEQVQADRITAVRELSRRYGNSWIVLKGHQTLIGRSTGEILVNSSGNPFLAQGGSGDVLAGYITGLLAQPALQSDPGKTIAYAVWQHGATADLLSENKPGWTIDDLIQQLGTARP